MSIRDIYLSDNNIDSLYLNVCDQVLNKLNFSLNSSPKYKNTVKGMMDKVYSNATKDTLTNLSALNHYTIQKISNYFITQLSKKQQGYPQMMDRPLRSTQNTTENELNNRLTTMRDERMVVNDSNKNLQPMQPIPLQDLGSTKGETDKKYKELLAARGNQSPQSPPSPQTVQLPQLFNDMNQAKQTKKVANANNDFNILPFTINDDFSNQASNPGQPLYFNSEELKDVTNEHVAGKYEDLQKTRNQEINDFLSFQQQNSNNTILDNIPANIEEFNGITNNNYLNERSNIDQINALRNPLDFNRTNIYTNNENVTGKKTLKEDDTKAIIGHNDLNTSNPIYDFLIDQIKNSQREYHDVPHYIVVSSEDRQWENNVENRYNFLVHFKPTSTQNGVGIDELYRNVVSVEVLKVIFPHDRLSVPFDNRVYLDLQSYPFLVMDIDELDGVFRGSNNTINEAFALLLFDKAYDSEILTHDQIHNSLNTTDIIKKRFDRQFKRGFMSFCPFLFEKKKYPNTPLASLNRMTIKFLRPDGQPISLDNDHLPIENITYVDNLSGATPASDIELITTPGFPRTSVGKYIEIETGKWFSNRVYRVGDLIKIKGYKITTPATTDQFNFQDFINRSQGHIIINLEQETVEESDNHGCINKLYISPPGDIDYSTGTLLTNSYYEPDPMPIPIEGGNGVLINSSMQVHITFKIVTREDKTTSVIKPFNV
jgi:hypothetical protein